MSEEKRKPGRRTGRRKAPHINTDKIEKRLTEKGMTKTELAKKAGIEYVSLLNAFKRESLTYYYVDRIGRVLNLAPEYIMDETLDGVFTYAFHLKQHTTPFTYVTETLNFMSIDTSKLSREQYVELSSLIYDEVSKKLAEWRIR